MIANSQMTMIAVLARPVVDLNLSGKQMAYQRSTDMNVSVSTDTATETVCNIYYWFIHETYKETADILNSLQDHKNTYNCLKYFDVPKYRFQRVSKLINIPAPSFNITSHHTLFIPTHSLNTYQRILFVAKQTTTQLLAELYVTTLSYFKTSKLLLNGWSDLFEIWHCIIDHADKCQHLYSFT